MGKKKCIISHHKTLKINVNDQIALASFTSFFPFFIFVVSINFFHSIILSTNIHMHIAISIFLRNH